MSSWENILVEWCNCLDISKKIEDFSELRNGDFFKSLLYIINTPEEFKNEENVFEILLTILNDIYKNAQIEYSPNSSFLEVSEDELKIITSLLMHYTCIYDRRDILTSPLCHRLSKNTQVCIKSFLQKVDEKINYVDLENIMKGNEVLSKNNDEFYSPLLGILQTPVSKQSKFHEKDKEITKLKNILELERYEKADLQEELRMQNEKIKKFEVALNNSNLDVIRLKTQISALESRTPPHFQAKDPTDTEKRLKKEIQSLEHYIEKTEREQEELQEETYNNRKKLKEWEQEYNNLHAKYSEFENKVEDLTKLSNNQASKITSLEAYCDELSGLLEEFQAKPMNESSMFETSTVNVRRSLTLVEESLACSVVEVQLKDAQKENIEMKLKVDSLNMQLDHNKKILDTKMKEFAARYNMLIEYTAKFSDIKKNISDMQIYYEEEMNECINYIEKIKQIFISEVVRNYENSIEKLSTALTNEKEISQLLSEKLQNANFNFEECNRELEKALNEKKACLDNFLQLEKVVDDLSKKEQELSSKLHNSEELNKNYTCKIFEIEKDNVKCKYRLDQLENEKEQHLLEIKSLKNYNNELTVTNENLNEKLSIYEDENKECVVQITLSKKTIENLETELKQAECHINKYTNEVKILKIDCEHLQTENENLSSKLIAAATSNAENSTKIQILEENIQLKKKELDKVMFENDGFIFELRSVKQDHEKLTKLNEGFTLRLAISEETIKQYASKVKLLEETVERKNDEMAQLVFDKDKYLKQINNIQHDYEELTKQVRELASENQEKNIQLVEKKVLEENFLNLVEIMEIYCQELDKATDLLKGQQSIIDMGNSLMNDAFDKLNKWKTSKKSQIHEKLDTLTQVGERISEISGYIHLNFEKEGLYIKERDNLMGKLTMAENSCQELKDITENLRKKIICSEEMIDKYVIRINLLEESLKLKEDEMNDIVSQKNEHLMQISNIQRDYQKMAKTALELSEENKRKHKKLIEKVLVEDDFIGLKKVIAGHAQDLNMIIENMKCHQLDTDYFNELREHNSLEGEKSSQKLDEINQFTEQISVINRYTHLYLNEIDSLKVELSAAKNDYHNLTKKNHDLTLKLSILEETNSEAITRMKLLEETIEQNNHKLNEIIGEKDKYVTQMNNVQHDYEEMTKRALNLSSENKEKHEQLIQKETMENEYLSLKETRTKFIQELNNVVKYFESKHLLTEMNKVNKLNIEELDETSELETQITKINNYAHIYVSEIEYLKNELAIARHNYQSCTEEMKELTLKLFTSEENNREHTSKIELLEKTIEDKNDKLNEVMLEKNNCITQILDIQHDYEESTKKALELSSENEEKDKLLKENKIIQEEYINLIKTIAMFNEELNKVVKSLKSQQPVAEMSDFQKSCNLFNTLSELNSPEKIKSGGELNEINQLGEQISKINSYIHLYSEKETFYRNEIDSLKGELATNSSNYFDLTENLREQNCENELLINSLTENLHSVIEKYNHLQVEHGECLTRINKYKEEITKLSKTHSDATLTYELKIANLQDEMLKVEDKILSTNRTHDGIAKAHQNKIMLLEDSLAASNGDVNLLKAELEKVTNEYNDEVNALKLKITELDEEKVDAEVKLRKLKTEYISEIQQLQSTILNKEELIKSSREQCEDNEAKISTLQVQIVMVKEELSQINKRSDKTEEEYQSTLANLQVQVVAGKLEISKLTSKIDALLVEKQECERLLKEMEEERNKETHEKTTILQELEKEREFIWKLKNELSEKSGFLGQYKDLKEKYEKLQQESMNQKFLEVKQTELQQKIETFMKSNEIQKETYEVFKIYFKEFIEKFDKILSQKNVLDRLANNLRVLVVSINKNAPIESFHLKTLFEKKEAMVVISEDIMKQYNRFSKQINGIVFDILKYYEKTCDDLLSTLDIKIESYSEKYNLEELDIQISDLSERTADALEQIKILQTDLENLTKVDNVKVQKENILGTSTQINVDKMKEDEMKKKNLALRQKVTLLENVKSNLEKTVKKLREENKRIKEGCDNTAPASDAHYNMLLQEYVAFKEKHGDLLKEYQTKLEQVQKEYQDHKNGCMRTSTPLGSERDLPSEAEKHLMADLNNLREAYSSIRSIKAKLEAENLFSKKLIEDQKEEIGKFNFMKEAYDKLLEENSKLMTDVDTMKYKRTRDRDEFLRLLKKERSESESRNSKQLQEIRNDYEAKLEKMKEKMIKLYRDEVNKEMSKVKAGQHEGSSLLKIIEQLKGDLFEAEQKIQVIEAERDMLRRSRDQTSLRGSRESFCSFQLRDSDTRSLRDFPASSFAGSSSAVVNSRGLSGASRPSVEFKLPNAVDTRRQSDVRRVSTLPRTGTVVEEVTLTRRTSFGVPDSLGPNLHMEDEEEMFNNKYLADLKQGKCDLPASEDKDSRVSELAWRNSLVPPHLKSSYPAEMQFCSPGRFKDDDLKTGNLPFDDSLSKLLPGEKSRKKDFGTTSYKKPGPPTPSKNGGRLSLQGNEVHPAREPPTEPKKSTPGRIRALFTGRNSSRSSTEVSSPKRRLNIFRR